MAEPDKRQIGDGSDNYGEAAKQMAKAAKEAGIETAKQAAVKGAEAGANAAAATVQAGVEGGKAVAEIAAGTAAGGPWGAILSAAWAMRHTLFKILVCICLFFLSSLFFSFLFIKLVRYADSTPELRCKVPVNLIFDEFNNVGKLGGAADGSDFARTLSVIRSRAIYVMLAVQSLGQLQNRYPNNLWAEIVGNLDVQLMLGCTDEVSAEYFSARSGDMSVEINSTMTVRKTIAVAQVIPQYRQTEGQGRRRLLTPDEVLRIPNEELLVVIRGHNVLKLKKFDYADHPLAKELTPVSILDYTPPHAAAPFLQTETTSPHAASEERPHTSSIPSKRRTLYSSAKPPSEF